MQHNQGIYQRFEVAAKQYATRVAVYDQSQIVTYNELLDRTKRLTNKLITQHETDPVAILLPASADYIAAMLACLAVGRPYVSLDISYPPEQLAAVLRHSNSSLLVTDNNVLNEMHSGPLQTVFSTLPLIITDSPLEDVSLSNAVTPAVSGLDNIAYIYYTSGSTGEPKGVYQNQRGMLHDVETYLQALDVSPSDCFTWIYSPAVLGSVRDVFTPLLAGAAIVPMPARVLGLKRIAELSLAYGVTVFHAIPPLLRALLNALKLKQIDKSCFTTVRYAYVAGDRFFTSDLSLFYSVMPHECKIYNGIGATECSTLYRHWFIDITTAVAGAVVPVGFAHPDKHCRVIDELGNDVGPGGVGEVEVSSAYLALGYWRNETLTAKAFRTSDQDVLQRVYRTGDLVRVTASGNFEFMGRKDAQVKIRGYRVDLAELEARLLEQIGVTDAAAFVTDSGELVAALSGSFKAFSDIKQELAKSLPVESLPNHFLKLDKLPRLANFKLDTRALKTLYALQLPPATTEQFKHTDLSSLIKQQWYTALKCKECDSGLTFDALGGDSLTALTLLVQLEQVVGHVLPLHLVDKTQTLDGLLSGIMRVRDKKPSLYLVPPVAGFPDTVLFARDLASRVNVHLVPHDVMYKPDYAEQASIPEIAHQVCEYLIQHHHYGPVHLIGLSGGVRIVIQTAHELALRGILNVGELFMADSGPNVQLGNIKHRFNLQTWESWVPPSVDAVIHELIALRTHRNEPKVSQALGWNKYSPQIKTFEFDARHGDLLRCKAIMDYVANCVIGG